MVYQDHMTKCVVKRTLYKVMFGVEAKVDLTPSSLPDEIISKISTEDDLNLFASHLFLPQQPHLKKS
jgi:hypothetical protein